MKQIVFPDIDLYKTRKDVDQDGCASVPEKLPFYLATEEWVARHLPPGEYFFTWVVAPTVIIGRNQDINAEVDLDFCRQNNIEVYRRRSGGGCVYADPGNIMLSYICDQTDVGATFSRFTASVAAMLQQLGLPAEVSGRNDLTVGGRKISGNAFYHLPGRSIVHGTMLYSCDPSRLLRAITPSRSKLESKRVKSVESRITTISDHLSISFDDFRSHIIDSLCRQQPAELQPGDIEQIRRIEQSYYTAEWTNRERQPRPALTRRIEGAGEFGISIDTDSLKRITSIRMTGDFMPLGDLDRDLFARLRGVELTAEAVGAALAGVRVETMISGLTNDQLTELLTTASHSDIPTA